MMHLVVCYDVTDDNRRGRLFEGLKGFIEHVQFSVFEGQVSPRDYAALIRHVEKTIDPSDDDVRIYRLCPRCRGDVDLYGQAGHVQTQAEDIIVG